MIQNNINSNNYENDNICCCCFDEINKYKCKRCTYSFCENCFNKLKFYNNCIVCKFSDHYEFEDLDPSHNYKYWIIKIDTGLAIFSFSLNEILERISGNRNEIIVNNNDENVDIHNWNWNWNWNCNWNCEITNERLDTFFYFLFPFFLYFKGLFNK